MPELAEPPEDERARELWLQHAAGFILFRDVGDYARKRLDPSLDAAALAAAHQAIDDALYGLMKVIDGVTGGLSRGDLHLELATSARLRQDDEIVEELDLAEGDGMCMGYHGWKQGDFGEVPVIEPPG